MPHVTIVFNVIVDKCIVMKNFKCGSKWKDGCKVLVEEGISQKAELRPQPFAAMLISVKKPKVVKKHFFKFGVDIAETSQTLFQEIINYIF